MIVEASNGGGADALVLAATSKIQGSGNLVVRGGNAANTMGIGGAASTSHSLQIDQTELAAIQAGLASITFGRGDGSGLITIGNGSTNANTTIQAATANMSIVGTYTTVGANLTLTTAGVASETASRSRIRGQRRRGDVEPARRRHLQFCKGNNDVGILTRTPPKSRSTISTISRWHAVQRD